MGLKIKQTRILPPNSRFKSIRLHDQKLLHQALKSILRINSPCAPHNRPKCQYCSSKEVYIDKAKNTVVFTAKLHISVMKNSATLTSYIKEFSNIMKISELQLTFSSSNA